MTIEQYAKLADVCAAVGLWLRAMLEIGYTFGWRVSEVKKLKVCQVDMASNRILLDPGTTKNDDGRVVRFKPGSVLANLLTACCHGKSADDPVFTREDGSPVEDFRTAWAKVCCVAGLGQMVCPITHCPQAEALTRFRQNAFRNRIANCQKPRWP